jgi:hypothetical protein
LSNPPQYHGAGIASVRSLKPHARIAFATPRMLRDVLVVCGDIENNLSIC